MNAPCENRWEAVVCILRYIKRALDKGLLYGNKGNVQIIGYFDTGWAGLSSTTRSTSRYCVFIEGYIISLRSPKQNILLLQRSSSLGSNNQLKELLQPSALDIDIDIDYHFLLRAALDIDIDYHFFREKKRFLHLRSLLVRSTPTITYIFTKSLRLRGAQVDFICRKVVTYMLQLRGIVLELNVRFKHMYHE